MQLLSSIVIIQSHIRRYFAYFTVADARRDISEAGLCLCDGCLANTLDEAGWPVLMLRRQFCAHVFYSLRLMQLPEQDTPTWPLFHEYDFIDPYN